MSTLADLQVGADQLAADLDELLNTARMVEFLATFSELSGAGIAVEAVDAGAVFSDPIAIAAGITAIIIAVAFNWIVAKPIAWALGKIPFIGGTLAGWVNDVGSWEWSIVQDWAHAAMDALWWLIQTVRTIVGFPWLCLNIMADLIARTLWIQNTQVPNAYNTAVSYAQALYNQATGYAQQLYNQAVSYAHTVWVAANAYSDAIFVQAVAVTHFWVGWLYARIVDTLSAANAYTDSWVQWLTSYVDTKFNGIEVDIGNAVTEAEQHADLALGLAITTVTATLGAAIAAAAATADGAAGIINNFLTTCGNDICEQDGQNAKNVKGLGQLISTGLIFGFLAECINDPVGTAAWSAPILTSTEGPALTLVDTLVTAVA